MISQVYWWPVTDEEWEWLNSPEKNQKTVD